MSTAKIWISDLLIIKIIKKDRIKIITVFEKKIVMIA